MILLQLAHETSTAIDAFRMFMITIAFLIALVLTGKINLGIRIPGVSVPMRRDRKIILKEKFPFYAKLSDENKRRFERKVDHFIYSKDFIPRQIEKVTEEMKVLIAACAVQLTMGFPNVALSYFKRILIYPDDYYSTISKKYHRGEVNPRAKAIVLSWRHFVEGYVHNTDGRNLGLHEMAHALRIENRISNNEYDFLDKDIQNKWEQLADEEIGRIRSGNSRMFRDYAGTNREEFFAVAVENFFECPQTFKNQMPELYHNLALLLRQDPLSP
ncbi:zinc-dependent peptidase [Reichenbachiella agarivorans]|uniref:Zinc-dependent peptidase n=1 Tax=Reichenbachiella agarivorans TaxID=2979464 RepID=A0ABY6CR37_9BACT|nr:zinc-dependent peptidase [Reichenbachiella agarivorans]UXP32977.1 zinc-dependent peptidase [Reichenbachiella agarivorans]